MSERCGCSAHLTPGPAAIGAPGTITPTMTVQAVADRSPRALEVLKALGINHCCGAHLTLTEAAASAGVPLATVLARLAEVGAAETRA